MSARDLQRTALQLKHDFDRGFALAPALAQPGVLDLLVVGVADQRYGLRLSQVAAVHAERRVVPVPTPDPKLLGLVGLRGGVAPVYDLALALGHARAAEARSLIELRSPKPCALAFTALEGHLRLQAAELSPVAGTGLHRLAAGTVPSPSGPLTIIDLLAVYDELTGQTSPSQPGAREGRT